MGSKPEQAKLYIDKLLETNEMKAMEMTAICQNRVLNEAIRSQE